MISNIRRRESTCLKRRAPTDQARSAAPVTAMRGHFTLAMPPALSRIARVVTLALFGVLAQIAVASAHASYTSSNPEDGDVVETAPSRYAIAFSEPVSPLSLKLVRLDGSSIPLERLRG